MSHFPVIVNMSLCNLQYVLPCVHCYMGIIPPYARQYAALTLIVTRRGASTGGRLHRRERGAEGAAAGAPAAAAGGPLDPLQGELLRELNEKVCRRSVEELFEFISIIFVLVSCEYMYMLTLILICLFWVYMRCFFLGKMLVSINYLSMN